jgi:hypothetical protein
MISRKVGKVGRQTRQPAAATGSCRPDFDIATRNHQVPIIQILLLHVEKSNQEQEFRMMKSFQDGLHSSDSSYLHLASSSKDIK